MIGGVLAVLTALSFTRAMQRLPESCWGLERRGPRGPAVAGAELGGAGEAGGEA